LDLTVVEMEATSRQTWKKRLDSSAKTSRSLSRSAAEEEEEEEEDAMKQFEEGNDTKSDVAGNESLALEAEKATEEEEGEGEEEKEEEEEDEEEDEEEEDARKQFKDTKKVAEEE